MNTSQVIGFVVAILIFVAGPTACVINDANIRNQVAIECIRGGGSYLPSTGNGGYVCIK